MICESIGQCENRLSAANFIRIHRSHVVNIDHIQEYIRGRGGYILLKDGSHLNVSARKKAHLLEALGR
ncbi:MAG: LytR/AlgR family response regulator transcription factor [Salibacteraceae bacterium]